MLNAIALALRRDVIAGTPVDWKSMDRSRHYFDLKGKNAEQFVHELAVKSFLTDWCFPNPVLPNGKELCDLLVVFDQTAIIWQIKDLKLKATGTYNPAQVEKNLRQLSGAKRRLFDLKTPVTLQNARRTIETFDPTQVKEVFLVSVLLGEEEDSYPIVEPVKESNVHRFSKDFTQIALSELDTIGDFTNYLRTKEAFTGNVEFVEIMGGEEELLAFYLMNNHSFEKMGNHGYIRIDEGFWNKLRKSRRHKLKKKEDKISYGWDGIIDRAHEGSKAYEIVARELARPTRFERRVLAKTFLQASLDAHHDEIHSIYRSVLAAKDVTYCFLFCEDEAPKDVRKSQLKGLCWVARGRFLENQKVVGVATEKRFEPIGSYDFCFLNIPLWTSEHQRVADKLRNEFGILGKPNVDVVKEAEYPE